VIPLKASTPAEVKLEYYQKTGPAEIRLGYFQQDDSLFKEALKLARQCQAAVVCAGFTPQTEGEGRDRTFALPAGQTDLINAVAEVNPKTIVVLTAGGNVETETWLKNVPVLVHVWYPGQEGGQALAEILFGHTTPSGKLPATFEKRWEDNPVFHSYYDEDGDNKVFYSEGILLGYRHYDKHKAEPLFPFGYGLSYTQFAYSNLVLSAPFMKPGKALSVSLDVENIGHRPGKEVVQLYISDLESSLERPVKELKGFQKVELKPGEKKTLEFIITEKELSFYDDRVNRWKAEPGKFEILIGSSSRDIRLRQQFELR